MKRIVCCMVWASACYGGADGDPTAGSTSTGSTGAGPQTSTPGDSGSSADVVTTGNPTTTSSDPGTSESGTDPTTGAVGSSTMEVGSGGSSEEGPMCLAATAPCMDISECCADLQCGNTSLGQVCCGLEGIPCDTPNGEDCCGNLLCIDGACGYNLEDVCEGPCTAAPALTLEKQRLAAIGGSFLGICGDANHTYGYHVPAAKLPADDYSLEGAANEPVCEWHAAAIDIGMDWPASRDWLKWLIVQIANDDIQGIGEVIGSYDGVNVRYWSDNAGWSIDGIPYQGSGHDTWTHVAIHRSTTLEDHGILAGWTADGGP